MYIRDRLVQYVLAIYSICSLVLGSLPENQPRHVKLSIHVGHRTVSPASLAYLYDTEFMTPVGTLSNGSVNLNISRDMYYQPCNAPSFLSGLVFRQN
jgi:hypothetical protein